MRVLEISPSDEYRKQQFIDLPSKIYRDIPLWVPPFVSEDRKIFDRENNPFFKHSQAAFYLAISADGSPVGRLAILNNRHFNKFNQARTTFFHLFECVNDPDVARALFDLGFEWARRQELNRIIGPRGFSSLDGLGMLINGFEHRPALGIPYNPPYYPALIEKAGFTPQSDIVSGYLSTEMEFPSKIHRIAEKVQERRGISSARYSSRRDLRRMVGYLRALYNEMIRGTTDNVPLTDEEADEIANQLLRFADPKLIKVIMKDNSPIGFMFAYPDISAALQRTHGQIFPFGWIDMLIEMRRSEWVNINGAGILPEYRGLGGTAILFSEMHKSIIEGKFKHAELVQIGSDNDTMLRELRSLGVDFYKTHRIYEKMLG